MSFRPLLLGGILFTTQLSADTGFAPGNLLVSSENEVYEYSADGVLQQQVAVPANEQDETARDIVVLDDKRLVVYNGTFYPLLSVYDGSSWIHHVVPGWNTVNNVSYGGIAINGDSVLVTDSDILGSDGGLVVIDPDTGASSRPLVRNEYIDVTMGQDGLLYALRNTYGDVDVIDPNSANVLHSVDLGHTSGSRGVTANATGDIFMVSWNDYVARYSPQGVLLDSLNLGPDLIDIDFSDSGQIAVGSRFGSVYLTDEELDSAQEIEVPGETTFPATFVTWVPPAPGPGC